MSLSDWPKVSRECRTLMDNILDVIKKTLFIDILKSSWVRPFLQFLNYFREVANRIGRMLGIEEHALDIEDLVNWPNSIRLHLCSTLNITKQLSGEGNLAWLLRKQKT